MTAQVRLCRFTDRRAKGSVTRAALTASVLNKHMKWRELHPASNTTQQAGASLSLLTNPQTQDSSLHSLGQPISHSLPLSFLGQKASFSTGHTRTPEGLPRSLPPTLPEGSGLIQGQPGGWKTNRVTFRP